ncbi:MAG: hypothetical protein WAU39_09220 [Polyangiales bacterium]
MLRGICGLALLAQVGVVGCGDSTGATGTGGTGGAGGTGGIFFEPGPTCIAFCAKVVAECDALANYPAYQWVDETSCQQGCEQNLSEESAVSEACGAAAEAVFLCASELDCQDVESWLAQIPADSFPCRSEVVGYGNCAPN